MPTQPFHIVEMQHGKSLEEQVEYLTNELAKTQKTLRYLLSNGNLDTENIRELNADIINAGTVNANLVTILSQLGNKYLRIDENGMVGNNGSQNVLDFDLNTGNLSIAGIITALAGMIGGWTIQGNALYSSTTTYPRVVLDPGNREISLYSDPITSIRIGAQFITGQPYIHFISPQGVVRLQSYDDHLGVFGSVSILDDLRVDFNKLMGLSGDTSLMDWFDTIFLNIGAKADKFTGYNGIIEIPNVPSGWINIHVDNGIIKNVIIWDH